MSYLKSHLFIISFVFFSLFASAQKKGAEITFKETTHNFDTIFSDDTAEHVFYFTNTGDEPLIISTTFTSCGCTKPEWPTKPIYPGQSDFVKVAFNTSNLGRFNKTAIVKSNAINTPSTLRIRGFVKEVNKDSKLSDKKSKLQKNYIKK